MTPTTQLPFDVVSWQSFVALNWPSDSQGNPTSDPFTTDPSRPRVWDYYKTAEQVFMANPVRKYPSVPPIPKVCLGTALQAGERVMRMSSKIDDVLNDPGFFEEAVVDAPLIDKNLNFAVYQVQMNRDEFEYIISNALFISKGQFGKTISFPQSAAECPPKVGAIELKSAWRILDGAKGDDPTRYFVRPARIYVPARHSSTGKEFCTPTVTLGLVGLHIIHRTSQEGNWIWSTFEHVDNSPPTTAPQSPVGAPPPPQPQCLPPSGAALMSFFNPQCRDASGKSCAPNAPPVPPGKNANWLWAAAQPYAAQYATAGKYGTQVVRCTSIYGETDWLNQQFRSKMAGTVFANYFLVASQWQSGVGLEHPGTKEPSTQVASNKTAVGGAIPTPFYAQNTVIETYLQNASGMSSQYGEASCLGCHSGAQTAIDTNANFSFLLGRAVNVP